MALAIMLVLTILVTSTLAFTSSNSRDASLKQQSQSAYALAEAGLNAGLAELYSHYYDSSGSATNNTTLYTPAWFTAAGVPSSQQSPSSTAACTSSSTCMSWSPVSWTVGGAAFTKGVLTLQGVGRVPNPTGAAPLQRTVTEKISMEQLPGRVATPSYWSELYTGATGQPCDLTLAQTVNANAPIYVAGNLCVLSAAGIEGSAVTLKVLGNIRLQNGGADIGKTTAVTSVQVGGGCVKSNNGSYVTPCPINTSSTQIWDRSGRTTAPVPTADPLPSVDFAGAASNQAASNVACTNGVSLSSATFFLTPSSGAGSTGYTCNITDPLSNSIVGSITYNSAAHTVALAGDIYISGNLDLSNSSPTTYTGVVSFFVAGTVTAANNTVLCAHVKSGTCDTANATNTSSPDYWDTTQTVMIIQSQGAITAQNMAFQGGLYSVTQINLGGGQSSTQGPLVSPSLILPGQSLNLSFPNFPFIISGSLGTAAPSYTLFPTAGGGNF
jgi:Tfp pilus assembly protein PilX